MSAPLVSVIVPVYNGEAYLAGTLASVQRQTYSNLEIMIVDDGSTDSTLSIAEAAASKDPRIHILHGKNAGVGAARNRGIEASTGAFIAPIDADDLWYSDKITLQVARMLESPESVGLVYAWSVKIDDVGEIISEDFSREFEGLVLWPLALQFFLGNASVPLIRRKCFEQLGGYREDLKSSQAQGCEDWDLALRIAERFEFRVVPRYLIGYRQLTGSMSANEVPMVRSHELAMRALAERCREIPDRIHRWSRALFYFYLHRRCVAGARYFSGLKWIARAVWNDPAQFLRPDLLYCLTSLILNWLCDRMFGTRDAWKRPLQWLRPKSEMLPTLSEVQRARAAKIQKSAVYEFIWRRRWRYVLQEQERSGLHFRVANALTCGAPILGKN
jgi:glycosyltransferase involved in cell wall biosynthesis